MNDTRATSNPPVPGQGLARLAGIADTVIGCALAAVSYGHIFDLARAAGEPEWAAALLAGTVDTLIITAFVMIGVARARNIAVPRVVRAALLAGVIATATANVHHGIATNLGEGAMGLILGVAVSLWAPIALELVYHCGRWLSATRPAVESPAHETGLRLVETAPKVTPTLVPSSAPETTETTTPARPKASPKTTTKTSRKVVSDEQRRGAIESYKQRWLDPETTTPSQRELAGEYGMSKTWALRVIADAHDELKQEVSA